MVTSVIILSLRPVRPMRPDAQDGKCIFRDVGVTIDPNKVANRILNGLDSVHDPMKYALQARSGTLTVDIVTEHLLAWERQNQSIPAPAAVATQPQYRITPMAAQNNTHRGPMATALNTTTANPTPANNQTTCRCNCCDHTHQAGAIRSPSHSTPASSSRFSAYPTPLLCHACGKYGHTHSRCWSRFPHLRPSWIPAPASNNPDTRSLPVPDNRLPPRPPVPNPTALITSATEPVTSSDRAITSYQFSGPDSSSLPPHTFVTSHEPCLSLQHLNFDGNVGENDEPGKWLIDSGASSHYSPFRHLFSFLQPISPIQILTGNGFIHAFFKGTIRLLVRTDNSTVRNILLENVLFVPTLQSRVNLFSIVVLANKGISSTFRPDAVHFSKNNLLLARGTRIGSSWWLDADTRSNSLCLALTLHPQTESVWHQRLGHLHLRGISDLQKVSTGIVIGNPPVPSSLACVGCLVGKQHRNISRMQRTLPGRRLGCIHIDISGPMQTPGYVGKHLYLAVLVDEATRWTTSYCLVKKEDIRNYFFEFVVNNERYTGDRVLAIFSDNEGTLLLNDFQFWLRENGIQHYTTQTYSPEMNGIAEATIKHIITRASAMLWTSQVPLGFWPEAVRCATYLKNRTPAVHGKTPFEAFHGIPPNLSHLRIFGCRCYAHVEKENRQKFDPHTAECIFLGYYETESLYAVYDVNRRTILKKRDVVFYEHILGHPSLANLGLTIGFNILGVPVSSSDHDLDCSPPDPDSQISPPATASTALVAKADPDIWVQDITGGKTYTLGHEIWRQYLLRNPTSPLPDTDSILARYTSHFHALLTKLNIPHSSPTLCTAVAEDDPVSWSAVLYSPNRSFWLHAAFEEICQIVRMRTFDFVPLSSVPPGRTPLPAKWVWKSKRDLHNNVEKFKARWVVRGDKQVKNIDYTETFAPVAKLSTIRILFTLVV